MAITNNAVSVGTTATPLSPPSTTRDKLWVGNNGAVTVYLGNTGVTTATGLPLAAGQVLVVENSVSAASDAWYGIVASGTCDVRVIGQ